MSVRMRRDINRINTVKTHVTFTELSTVNERKFILELGAKVLITNGTDADLTLLTSYLRARDAFGPRQIDYLTKLIQVIKMAFPVRSDSKDINTMTTYINDLLTFVLFDNDLVSKTGLLNCSDPFHQ